MAKYEVLRDCYGFQNRYWEKGTIVEIDSKDKPPHHFARIGENQAGPEATKAQKPKEASTAAEIAREELLVEARGRGIKDAEILNQEELLEVLAKDTSRQKMAAIIQKAKKRQK
jgi:hypothetical protein